MRRMADQDLGQAATWSDLTSAHARFFHNYNHQPHFAHQKRAAERRSPAAVLGWVQGAWCDPADLDRLFRLRATRVLDAAGSVRFRHWRLYGERGLAGEPVAVWVWGEDLTVEYATDTLAQYRVTFEADGRRLREVSDLRLLTTRYASPQPFLPSLEEVEWHPARRLAPYRPRRRRWAGGQQVPLFPQDSAAIG
jgi:hypothetical protein